MIDIALQDSCSGVGGRSRITLNDIAKELNREIKKDGEEDFVFPTPTNTELSLKFEIVKHVIEVRLAERDASIARAEKQAQKERIKELLAKKQDEALAGKSEEELKKMLDDL